MPLSDKLSESPNFGDVYPLLEFMEIASLFGIFKSALTIENYLRTV